MKNILYRLLLLPLLLAAWGAQAQAPAWLNAYGVPTTSSVFGTATNTAGDVFVTGNFSGSATFGGTTLTSAGEDDIFVAKWNSTSNSWAWAVRGGGSAADQGNGIAVNGTNVYVTGYFNSNGGATFGNFATTFNGTGGQEIFLAKFVDGGTSVTTASVVSAGGGSSDQGRAVAVNGTNVYITGYVTGAASFGGAALTPVYTTFDAYVAKYVDSGTLTYNSALRAGGSSLDRGNSIAVNGTNIYVAGDFRSLTAAFGSTTITNSNTDANNLSYDAFVAKFTDSGTLAHATAVRAGGGTAGSNSPLDFANDIAVSGTSIYLTGAFSASTISFGNGVTLTNSDNTNANSDMYLAKYTDSGAALTAVAATRSTNSSVDVGSSVAVTGSTVYVAGNLVGSAVYGSSTIASSGGGQDIFVAKFTDAGSSFTPVGAITGGGTGDENANGLVISGTQVIVGGFLDPAQSATFVTNSGTTTIPAGNGGFIARVGVVVTLPTVTTTAASLIASTSATLGGNVTADGGGAVTDRGVVYSTTNTTPAIGGTGVTQNANGTGTGTFSETSTGLTASTTYYVRAYAINSAGTSYGAVISFTTAAPVSGTTVVTNVSCFGGSNGTINLTPTGGLAPYTFAWNNGTTTEDRTGLSAGTYSVVITDAAGATGAVNNIVVGQPTSALSAGTTSQTTIACNGGATGAASISPVGGTAPYTYRWSTGATTQGITGLRAATYTVTVTDANGCTISRSFNITEPSALTATTSQTDVTTNGGSNGSATITVSGGTPSYTYAWSPNVSTTATASNLSAGTYSVTATDANGCTITRSFTIGQPSAPTITVAPATLANGTVGTAYSQTIMASGGTAPYSYGLTAGALPTGLTLTSGGTLSGTPTAGGTFNFTVTATDAGSFTGSRAYTVTVAAPTITVAPASLPAGTVAAAYSQTITASGGTAPYTFAITAGALPSGLTLTSGGTLSGTPTANGTFNFTVTATDASTGAGTPYSGSLAYSLTIASPANTVWTGNVSTDWLTAGNWTAGVPTAAVDAIIPANAPRYPTLAANAAAKNLSLNSGATLTHTTGTLTLTANLTNNGTYTAPIPAGGAGAIVSLGSTQLASILGSGNTRFRNLTIGANGAQSSTSASTSVQRLFTLNGNFTTNGNPLTLESNVNATAMVINNGTSVLNGTVTVQRYIVPDLNPGLGYRHVSTPISNATVASLTTGSFTPVVNPAYNTSATPTSERPFPTIYGYDQSRLATTTNNLPAFDKGWFSPAALSDAMTVGQGYTVNIGASQTWNFLGAVNNGNISQTLTRNAGATTDDSGLQLVGNPYPSPLDWQNVASADHPGVDDVIYVWQSNTPGNPYAGNYGFYQNGFGNVNPVLALGQAFFVRVKAGQTSGTLNLKNSHRSTSYTNPTYHRTAAETRPTVQLTLKGAGSVVTDDAFVYFQEGATNGYDSGFDAEKLVNPSGLNLSTSLSAKQRLSIDGRGLLGTAQQVVPLAVGVPAVGSYSLSTTQLLNLDATPVYLRDLQLGTVTDLRLTPSYQFTVSNASALITGRFELVFSPQQALATVPAALAQQVALYPNPAKKAAFVELPASLGRQAVTASLVDALGRQVRTVSLPAQGAVAHQLDLSELATGVYALRLSTSAGVVVKKLVIE